MDSVCQAHNRRYSRREHKHHLRLFCRYRAYEARSSRTELSSVHSIGKGVELEVDEQNINYYVAT